MAKMIEPFQAPSGPQAWPLRLNFWVQTHRGLCCANFETHDVKIMSNTLSTVF